MIAYCSLLVNGPPASENEKGTQESIEGSCSCVGRETWATVGAYENTCSFQRGVDSSPLPKGAH